MNGGGRQGRANKVVPGKQRGSVLREGQGEIEKDALEDDENTDGENHDANGGTDPRQAGLGCPRCLALVSMCLHANRTDRNLMQSYQR